MTNEQLAIFIQQGGADDLIPVLWERVRRIVFKICSDLYAHSNDIFKNHGIELEDFKQECYPAFLKAIKSYSLESNYQFTTYLRFPIMQIKDNMLNKRRIPNPLDICVSLNTPTTDDENASELEDFIEDNEPSPEQMTEKRSTSNIINNAIKRLSEKEILVIRAYFFDEITLTAVAAKLHMSRQAVAQIKDRGLGKLRKDPEIIQLYKSMFG